MDHCLTGDCGGIPIPSWVNRLVSSLKGVPTIEDAAVCCNVLLKEFAAEVARSTLSSQHLPFSGTRTASKGCCLVDAGSDLSQPPGDADSEKTDLRYRLARTQAQNTILMRAVRVLNNKNQHLQQQLSMLPTSGASSSMDADASLVSMSGVGHHDGECLAVENESLKREIASASETIRKLEGAVQYLQYCLKQSTSSSPMDMFERRGPDVF